MTKGLKTVLPDKKEGRKGGRKERRKEERTFVMNLSQSIA
jgi:hypothetical protein